MLEANNQDTIRRNLERFSDDVVVPQVHAQVDEFFF